MLISQDTTILASERDTMLNNMCLSQINKTMLSTTKYYFVVCILNKTFRDGSRSENLKGQGVIWWA